MEENRKHIAQPDYPVHELFKRRWSPVAFSLQPFEPEKLAGLLEVAPGVAKTGTASQNPKAP